MSYADWYVHFLKKSIKQMTNFMTSFSKIRIVTCSGMVRYIAKKVND